MRSIKRFRSRTKIKATQYLRCGVKTITFLFWASLYMFVMKITIFKSNVQTPLKDWSMMSDNHTNYWRLQGQDLHENDLMEIDSKEEKPFDLDNETIIELEKRTARVQDVCRQKSVPSQFINSKEFFVDYNHNLVWCNIFKAASSSWLYNFNILGGYEAKFLARTRHTPLTLARKKFPRPNQEELRDAVNTPGVISFLIVREPFVRLLSAYRDKLENVIRPYYKKLARSIVLEHRNDATKVLGRINSIAPTFYEFVAYLISENSNLDRKKLIIDEHWAPYYQFCTPCAINFTVIAKVETLPRDTAYVINQLGLDHLLSPTVKNRKIRLHTINKSRDGRNTESLLKYYFNQIDEQMLKKLLKIYETDFEMFGYDPNVYTKYVRMK